MVAKAILRLVWGGRRGGKLNWFGVATEAISIRLGLGAEKI